jgi:heme O synthase-like polyprenyltransferase
MTRIEDRPDEFGEISRERYFIFTLTLIVTTFMVAVTAYVLSVAFISDGDNATAHRAAIAAIHARS